MNIDWLKVNPLKELRESCPVRFWEIGLQSWQISKSNGWVPTFRGGGTHWVFLATPWFFAWTQFDWRSIHWESYVNPVLCVFEKLAYKVGIFHKKLAEFLRFMGAVLIEFSLRQTGSLHEPSLTECQSSERVTWILSRAFLRSWLTKLANFKKQWLSSYASWWRVLIEFSLRHPGSLHEHRFTEGQSSERVTWILSFAFFAKLTYKVGIFHKKLAEFLWFVLAVLIEFSLRHPGSLHEHRLTEGQSTERVTWILSSAFLRNWLTKLANFKKQWLSSYVSWWRYSLSFPCDTLVLCMNTVWLKVNPVRELRESCPVRFWEIGLQSWYISQKIGWVPTFHGGGTHWVFLATNWFFAWTQLDWRSIQWLSYVNPVLCVFEKLAYKVGKFQKTMAEFLRFVVAVLIEFSLRHPGSLHEHRFTEGQSSERVTWILSCAFLRNWLTKLANFKNNFWVPTFHGGCTLWVFLETPWFFEWTQFDWRSIQWKSYVNPVLWVFEKLAYKVGIFHKTLAEFLRFVLAVLIEFSLQRPGSLHEHSLTEGQSSERVTWNLSRAFLRNRLTKLVNFKKQWLSSYVSWWRYSLSFPCDTLVLWMNPAWLKVNPVRKLRESCPVHFWEIGLQSWYISQKIGWVPTFHRGR